MKPQVSVVIPNYNHAPYLEQRIESVLNQTYPHFEVILMDDCSTDTSVEILKKYANHPKIRKLLLNEHNSGNTFRQWKKGINEATGKYIWIAESDDVAHHQFLEVMVEAAEESKASLSYCRSMTINEKGEPLGLNEWADTLSSKKWKAPYVNNGLCEIKNYLSVKNIIPNASSALILKEDISFCEKITELRYCGDWYFYITVLKTGKPISFTPKVLNYFRYHEGVTRSRQSVHQERKRLNEYITTIRYAREAVGLSPWFFKDAYKYTWIINQACRRSHRVRDFAALTNVFPPGLRLFSLAKYLWYRFRLTRIVQ